jgi:hypothetical protein
MNNVYTIHIDYDKIFSELNKLQSEDKDNIKKLSSFVTSLRDLTHKIQPILELETRSQHERELWHRYEQIQQDKLFLLELSHEWKFLEETAGGLSKNIKLLIQAAIEELADHINVIAGTHKAHIDLLEIRNTRRLNILILIISTTISYITLWEFIAREFILTIVFPDALTPILNYTILFLTLLPIFLLTFYAWISREKVN